jgi:hypothetical protein
MRILKKLILGLVVLVALLAVGGLLLPSSAHVERTISINAPPENIRMLVNDFRRFNEWSPWAKRDPETRYTFEGPPSGVGSKMKWVSEKPDVGSGSQEITVDEPTMVKTALDFGDQGQALAFFKLEPTGTATKVTWGFDSEFGYNLIGRYFGLMFDKWLGADYEQGLASLKALAEAPPKSG